jgi:hypothetical protein
MNPLERLESWLRITLWGALALAGCILVAGPFWLALGTDEAWILSSIQALSQPLEPDLAIVPTLTSGGPFALIHGSLFAAGVTALWVHRFVTLAFVALALVGARMLLPSAASGEEPGSDSNLLLGVGLFAAPGALTLGGLGHAEWMATALSIFAVVLWNRTEGRRAARMLGCGVVLGLAMATRSPAIALAPGLLVWALISGPGWRGRLVDAIGTLGVAFVLLGASIAIFAGLAADGAEPPVEKSLSIMGLTGLVPNYPRLLNRWLVGERLLPVGWLTVVTGAAAYWGCASARERNEPLPTWTLLLLFAWSSWAAWMLRAPIAHLRYLWPGLGLLGVAVGITLVSMHRAASRRTDPTERTGGRAACLVLALALMVAPVVLGFRALVNGQPDLVMWEWSGQTALTYSRRFQHVSDQHEAAAWLREQVPASEGIAVFAQPFPLRYLSDAHVRAHWTYLDDAGREWRDAPPGWIVLQPHNHAFRYLSPEAHAWIEAECTLGAQFGSYAIYRVTGSWPDDLTIFQLHGRPVERFPNAVPRFGSSQP